MGRIFQWKGNEEGGGSHLVRGEVFRNQWKLKDEA